MSPRLALLALALLVAPLAHASDEPAPPAFRLVLRVESESGAHDEVALGVAEGATDAFDRGLDKVQAPRPFGDGWLQAHVVAPAARPEYARLQTSLVAPAPWVNLTARVEDGALGAATLRWSPDDLAALPERFVAELRVGAQVVDARAVDSLALDVSGDAPVEVEFRLFPLQGALPAAPRDVRALPRGDLSAVRVTWAAPADEGGAPLRGFVVYRDGAPIATLGLVAAYDDPMPETGAVARYAVAAYSVLGEGPLGRAAPVVALRPLAPADAPPGWEEEALADEGATVPGQQATTPPIQEDVVTGRPHEDGERYVLHAGGHELVLYSAGLLDAPLGPTLLEERTVALPESGVGARLAYRHDAARCDGPLGCAGTGAHAMALGARAGEANVALAAPLP